MIGSCPDCNGKLSSNAKTCPHCGRAVVPPAAELLKAQHKAKATAELKVAVDGAKGGTAWMAFGIVTVVALLLAGAVGYIEYNRSRSAKEQDTKPQANSTETEALKREIDHLKHSLAAANSRIRSAEAQVQVSLRQEQELRRSESELKSGLDRANEARIAATERNRALAERVQLLEADRSRSEGDTTAKLRTELETALQKIRSLEDERARLETGRVTIHLKSGGKIIALSCLEQPDGFKCSLPGGGSTTLKKEQVEKVELSWVKLEDRPIPQKGAVEAKGAGREFISAATWEAAVAYAHNPAYTSAQKEEKWKAVAGKYLRMKAQVVDVSAYDGRASVEFETVDEIARYWRDGKYERDKVNGSVRVDEAKGKRLSKGEIIFVALRIGNSPGYGSFQSDLD